jgi:hypothetical protein
MIGMGMVFSFVALGLMVPLALYSLFVAGVDWDDLDFMIVAPIAWAAIAFGLGMLYGGLLALVARGRSFRDVSILRVALAGAAIGLIPALVVLVGSLINGGSPTELKDALAIFPPLGGIIGAVTLLIARRAKNPFSRPHNEEL